MNSALTSTILGCLRVSGSPEPSVERLQNFGARAWKRTTQWLDHSGLALLLWHRLKELGRAGAVPPALRAQLEQSFRRHRARVARMAEEFDSINRCFEGAGLPYCALKGFALIPEYCPDACLRTTYDHDYLLPRECLRRAEEALRAAGYVRKPEQVEHPLVYFHQDRPPWSPLRRDDLYSAQFPATVELHDRFWDDDELKIPLRFTQNFFADRRPRCLSSAEVNLQTSARFQRDLRFYALGEEDELIFQVLHAFRHILQNWCRLCSLLDIAWFLERRSLDAAFWARFGERIRGCEPLPEIVGIVFSLSAILFGATIPDLVAAETAERLRSSVALWVQRYGENLGLNNFSGSKFSLFLHREFVSDKTTWRAVERSSLFPLHRPNQAAKTSNPRVWPRLVAGSKQGLYVAGRLKDHLLNTVRYKLESRRWERARAGSR